MASLRVDIISIGTLSRNLLWNEAAPVRTPHATCALIRAGKRNILIDPGLPAVVLAARLNERTGLSPQQIDTVFLTNFRPAHRAGIDAFAHAKRYIHELERDAVLAELKRLLGELEDDDDDAVRLSAEKTLLDSLSVADDHLAPGVDLFPLFGYTAGTCGLIVASASNTTLIAGDAVPTLDHFLAGQVLPGCADLAAAKAALAEVYEIADVIVPGHDNVFVNPRNYGI